MHCLRSPPPRYDSNNHPHARRPLSNRSVVGKEGAVIGQLHRVIRSIEDEWGTKRLLVIGDVMLDKYIWGEVGRISPEAPVPVVRGMRQDEKPGGAANVAMNLARLGAQTTVVGMTGEDENARLLTERLRSNGITPCLIASEEFDTITKTRILGGRQQMLRLDFERSGAIAQSALDRLLKKALELLPGSHALVLSDYAKGVMTPAICQTLILAARKLGIPVLVDPKSSDYSLYRGATTICPNLVELAGAVRLSPRNLDEVLTAAEAMVTELDIEFLTATLSDKGIALVRPGNRFVAPAQARQVFDVSGAGDTVVAVLALGLASGVPPETAVQLANIAAGIVVGKVGTVPVEKHELLAALNPQIALNAADRVLTRDELVKRVALWKANGERVVFTNGCFDLLHIGHITLLEQARRCGDRLIVAINSDASVSCLKGPNRPIVREADRARVLAALAAVDAVVVFDESTPLELILAVQPDVLVKGGDYKAETIVGANEIQTWGGEVRIVPLVEGFSTTRLIEKGAGH
jgi:D-beta-D-heptose 7-phosphate kinase / D-beta-D-heptose 1-phosphate adenosyltransferase